MGEACRKIAIGGGFSVHETIRIVHAALAFVEFSHSEAAQQFVQASGGSVRAGHKVFTARHQGGSDSRPVESADQDDETDEPTSTLHLRGLPEMSEKQLLQEFSPFAPRIKKAE